jgi:hypothetical protein
MRVVVVTTLITVERDVMEQVVAVMTQVAFLNAADMMIVALMMQMFNNKKEVIHVRV